MPVRLPELAKAPKRIDSADDVARLVETMPVDYRVAVLLGAMGLREAEVFGLTVGAVDLLRRTVTVRPPSTRPPAAFVAGESKTASAGRPLPHRLWCRCGAGFGQ